MKTASSVAYQCLKSEELFLSPLLVTFLFYGSPSIRHRRHKSMIIIFLKIRLWKTGKQICLSQLEQGKGGGKKGLGENNMIHSQDCGPLGKMT